MFVEVIMTPSEETNISEFARQIIENEKDLGDLSQLTGPELIEKFKSMHN